MPIYIEQIETQKLYGKAGDWTSDPAMALDFLTVSLAQKLRRALKLRDAHILELDAKGGRAIHQPVE